MVKGRILHVVHVVTLRHVAVSLEFRPSNTSFGFLLLPSTKYTLYAGHNRGKQSKNTFRARNYIKRWR